MTEEPTKVLLVDDRPENLLALEQILRDPDLELVKASSGNEGLAKLLTEDFACVLLDVNMPGMDGFETARFIRQDDGLSNIPIIFVTATSVATTEIFRGYQSGAVDYLLKPLDPQIVRSKLDVFVRLYRQRRLIAHQARLLGESNAELSRANAELQRFAAVAAHDLKNPLSTMMTYADALLEDRVRSEARRASLLRKIKEHAHRAADLIDDLLEYYSCGEEMDSTELVECRQVVERALENLDGVSSAVDALVQVEDLPVVAGNPGALVRLFENLIANALRYRSPERRIIVHVGSARRGSELCFWVRDNGIGIGSGYEKEIFEPFTRVPGAEGVRGTGIGLAICQRIVEQHGGRIWVESILGEGSTFFFTLPGVVRDLRPAQPT